MIAYVKGMLKIIQDEAIVVETGGIGYELICPNPFHYQRYLNQEVLIHTYFHVREDAQILYGFKDTDEKLLFKKLISVSGIGPKSALGILSAADIPSFVAAVENEDEKYLMTFPGVGKKTARQIILDLKGKLSQTFEITPRDENLHTENQDALQEAKEALKALGYTEKELSIVIPELRKASLTNTDEMVKKGLALLLKK